MVPNTSVRLCYDMEVHLEFGAEGCECARWVETTRDTAHINAFVEDFKWCADASSSCTTIPEQLSKKY
jgi:hypothetical protein